MPQKQIGPNFTNELSAANLIGLPFSWDAEGNLNLAELSVEQQAAVQSVYAAHDPSKPDPNVAAAALLAAGLTITSAGTPALNGIYGTSPQDQVNMTGLQVSVAAGVFPGSVRDRAGAKHEMTAAQFTAIATAILGFIVAINDARAAALAGGAWVAPATEANIP